VLVGLYSPGNSLVHRAPAGPKLAALAGGLLALGLLRSPTAVVTGAVVVALVATVARLAPRLLWFQLRPVLWFAAFVAAFQVWVAGPRAAALAVGFLLVAVAAAALVTLTTRTQDLLDALVAGLGPFRRVGVDAERVALVLALAVRSIAVLADVGREVREARRARGAERSARALVVPLAIRSLRHADRLGEALKARGVDD
jgi:biotin transport system permease protein